MMVVIFPNKGIQIKQKKSQVKEVYADLNMKKPFGLHGL